MSKNQRHIGPIKDGDVQGRMPKGAQYNALKGMSYRPSARDQQRKARKDARQSLKRGDW